VFGQPSALKPIEGNPDFVLQADGKLFVPVEVKTKWVLDDDDSVEQFNGQDRPACVIDSIMQIFGYMGHNKRQYGVLSTYDKTWFLWRPKDDPGPLLILDVVKGNGTSPTLLRCFAYIMLARQDSDCPTPPRSPGTLEDNYDPPATTDDEHKDSTFEPPKEPPSGSRSEGMQTRRVIRAAQEINTISGENRRHLVIRI
jgi:hypothetical protein